MSLIGVFRFVPVKGTTRSISNLKIQMMRTYLLLTIIALVTFSSFTQGNDEVNRLEKNEIHWYTLEEAIAAQEESPKMIFIDVYTDWCGWCKVMDNKTFTDHSVIEYMNENFYAVKLDAEQKTPIKFNGREYKYIARGKRGINEIALDLLDMQPSYPAFVILDEELKKSGLFKGYSEPRVFMDKVGQILEGEGS